MLDPKHDASWTETHRQSFSINYNYPVYFTRDLFDPANPCLQGALAAVEPDKRHRFALFVDEGVTLAAPNLLPRIARHAGVEDDAVEPGHRRRDRLRPDLSLVLACRLCFAFAVLARGVARDGDRAAEADHQKCYARTRTKRAR